MGGDHRTWDLHLEAALLVVWIGTLKVARMVVLREVGELRLMGEGVGKMQPSLDPLLPMPAFAEQTR